MEFVKEFAIFLYKNNIIRFGNFTLASGKNSSYYVDLRLIPSSAVRIPQDRLSSQKSVQFECSHGSQCDQQGT